MISVLIIVGVAVAIFVWAESVTKTSTPSGGPIQSLAEAIAKAEGFFVNGSLPNRANNPGDLKVGDKGQGTIDGKTIFSTIEEGWQHLYYQVSIILNGTSSIYTPDMTIQEVANRYVNGNDQTTPASEGWARNVANSLGVTVDTPVGQVS